MSFTYKGLQAQYQRHLVTAEELEQQMDKLLQQTPKIIPITDRPAQNGDELVLDYAGFVGDEQFTGGTAQNQTLTLGSGMFIPGFEEQLIGTLPGQSISIRVTFPTEYHAPNLAGKEARFDCLIHQIRLTGSHEPNDEFAKALGLDNFESLQNELRSSMQAYADNMAELDLGDQLLRMAAATLEDFQPDEAEVQKAIDGQMQHLRTQLSQQGLTLDMYYRFTGADEAQIREDMRSEAEHAVRVAATVERIAHLESLTASEEDIAQMLDTVCQQNHLTMEDLQENYDADFQEAVVYSILMRKTMRLLQDNAILTETFN